MRNLKNLCVLSLGVAALALGMSSANAADKPTLKIGYVNGWDDSVAATHVAGEILQSKLGYTVELKAVEPAIMWQGVARGDPTPPSPPGCPPPTANTLKNSKTKSKYSAPTTPGPKSA